MTGRATAEADLGRPALLDLFCCSGGAGAGYARAGFEVTGVDIVERPRYPYTFVQGDALEYLAGLISSGEIRRYALVHASPPCRAYCAITKGTNARLKVEHPRLYEPTRDLLAVSGVPHVIENPAARPDVVLCGDMFDLGVIRHRRFELGGWFTLVPPHTRHRGRVRGHRHGESHQGPYVAAYGKGGGKATVPEMQAAMGIDWTDVHEELTEALPPAYAEWIGTAYLAAAGFVPAA